MKHESAKRQDRIMYREYVVAVYMPKIIDKQKRKVATAQLRAALARAFDRLEAAGAELLPRACGLEIAGCEDGTHVVTRGGRKIVPRARRGQ